MADSKLFSDFLRNLSVDVGARTSFQEDPVRQMSTAGLSDSQIVAVMSQDPGRIQSELGDLKADALRVRVIVTILVEF